MNDPTPLRKPPQKAVSLSEDLTVPDVELMIRIAKERAALMDQFREALDSHHVCEVFRLGRMISGLPPEVSDGSEPNRSDPAQYR